MTYKDVTNFDTLYHYCSVSNFFSIITHNSIWLSSLSLSNDYMEGKLVKETFDRLLQQSEITNKKKETILQFVLVAEKIFDGLGFCLSQEPDLLSQWRGYADDGQGFSIGFSKSYLQELSGGKSSDAFFHLKKVIYDPEKQKAALEKPLEKIKAIIESENFSDVRGFWVNNEEKTKKLILNNWQSFNKIGSIIYPIVYTLKNLAFKEESEWRLIAHLIKDYSTFKENRPLIDTRFRVARNRLIPYREVSLVKISEKKRITDVYIGPKNNTPDQEVERFLYLNGHSGVTIHRSSASYR